MADGDPGRGLARRLRALPLRARVRLAWRLLRDRRTPLAPKLIMAGAVGYLVMPVDIIPDFIPVIGQLDDLLLVILAVGLFIKLMPEPLLREHIERLEIESA